RDGGVAGQFGSVMARALGADGYRVPPQVCGLDSRRALVSTVLSLAARQLLFRVPRRVPDPISSFQHVRVRADSVRGPDFVAGIQLSRHVRTGLGEDEPRAVEECRISDRVRAGQTGTLRTGRAVELPRTPGIDDPADRALGLAHAVSAGAARGAPLLLHRS